MGRTAIVLGATGLVGNECVKQLLNDPDYDLVKVLHRRKLNFAHPKMQQHLIDFSNLYKYAELFKADDLFCCLGTTMKKAGSKENFIKVDYHYPLRAAELALAQGTTNFMLVSAIGAKASSMFFYNRIKGEVEKDLKSYGFGKIGIFRPSILDGNRRESRPGESSGLIIMKLFSPFLIGGWRKFRPIKAKTVAAGMISFAKSNQTGIYIFESEDIKKKVKS